MENSLKKIINQFSKSRQPVGPWESYYPGTDKIFYTGRFLNGKKSGLWIFYTRTGDYSKKLFYL